jgi:hypothetical protein
MRNELCLAGLLVASVAAAAPPGPVIAHWSFDEANGDAVADSGPHRLDVKVQSDKPVKRVAGMCGRAVEFPADGKAFAVVPRNAVLDLKPPFTIAAWIKVAPQAKSSAMEIHCCKGDGSPNQKSEGWRFRWGWQMIYFEFGDGQEAIRFNSPHYSVPAGYWTHVAATHDGRMLRLFRNAKEIASQPMKAVPAPAKNATVIGNFCGRKDAYPFIGQMDELIVIGRALDAEALYRLASGMNQNRQPKEMP